MTNYIKYGFQFVIFTNLLISLAAAAQLTLTYILLELPFNLSLTYVELTSTLLYYNVALYLSLPKNKAKTPFLRTNWIVNHLALFYTFSGIALLVLLYHFLQLSFILQISVLGIGVISALYVMPFFKYGGRKVNLRSIPYIKVFFIAFIWVLSTFLLPVIDALSINLKLEGQNLYVLALNRFVFLLLCTLPFDLRDIKSDKLYGLKTVPILIGQKKSILLINILIALHVVLSIVGIKNPVYKLTFVMIDIAVGMLFNFKISKQGDYLSVFLMDLVLVLQFVILYVVAMYSV